MNINSDQVKERLGRGTAEAEEIIGNPSKVDEILV